MWNRNQVGEIEYLISKKKYPKAIKLLRMRVHENPDNAFLQQQLAELLARTGEQREAMGILNRLAEQFAQDGFASKAIAILKKMQRINPGLGSLEQRIAELVYSTADLPKTDEIPVAGYQAETASDEPADLNQAVPIADANSLEIVLGGDGAANQPSAITGPSRSPLFNDFSSEELLAVIQGLNLLNFESGEIVCSEGEPGGSMFLLAGGTLRVYVRNARGRNNQVRVLESGSFFGEISLISKEPRSATIVCASPCEILELDMDALKTITQNHPNVPRVIHAYYKRRLNSPEEQEART
ncbi:MAG: cyclic nucleotide-binding domain-containing protein [Acidobacteriota bacterium]|nr:cyclic nucleotide-binding domain-containing protein [Acidobacteriota bacterium]